MCMCGNGEEGGNGKGEEWRQGLGGIGRVGMGRVTRVGGMEKGWGEGGMGREERKWRERYI